MSNIQDFGNTKTETGAEVGDLNTRRLSFAPDQSSSLPQTDGPALVVIVHDDHSVPGPEVNVVLTEAHRHSSSAG